MVASFIVIGLTACGNDSATTENGSTPGTTAANGADVSGDVTGTYVVDMEAVREQLRAGMEAQAAGSSEAERQMAEGAMTMMEGFLSVFEGWKLEIKGDNSFLFSQSETEQLEGTWSLDGDQMTLTPVRVMDGAGWEEAEGETAEILTVTWDASTNTLKLPMEPGADEQLIFTKVD